MFFFDITYFISKYSYPLIVMVFYYITVLLYFLKPKEKLKLVVVHNTVLFGKVYKTANLTWVIDSKKNTNIRFKGSR